MSRSVMNFVGYDYRKKRTEIDHFDVDVDVSEDLIADRGDL